MSSDIETWPPPDDPTAFESLCLDLWREIWGPNCGAQKNGRSGQPQAGVDVFGWDGGGDRWVGVQCKQKSWALRSRIKLKELDVEVGKARGFVPQLSLFIVATTGPRDEAVQRRAREIMESGFRVEVWSWADLWHEIYRRENLLRAIGPIYWPKLFEIWSSGRKVPPAGTQANEDLRSHEDPEQSLILVKWNIAIILLDRREQRHIPLAWDPAEIALVQSDLSPENIVGWKKVHRIAEQVVTYVFDLKVALVSTQVLPLAIRADEIQRAVDSRERALKRACRELGVLPPVVGLNEIAEPLAYLRLLPDAVKQDLASSHNGTLYLLPSLTLIERAMEWSLHALHVADLAIEIFLEGRRGASSE